MATHYTILAWRAPWTEEPGGLRSIGLQRVRHNLACIHLTDTGSDPKSDTYKLCDFARIT